MLIVRLQQIKEKKSFTMNVRQPETETKKTRRQFTKSSQNVGRIGDERKEKEKTDEEKGGS